jgi:hypothetical protein
LFVFADRQNAGHVFFDDVIAFGGRSCFPQAKGDIPNLFIKDESTDTRQTKSRHLLLQAVAHTCSRHCCVSPSRTSRRTIIDALTSNCGKLG